VFTLRNMPSVAEYGWSSIAHYLLGAVFFFVPLALVVAELGTGWPKAGGLYAWVKEGFGDQPGFLAVWFEWVENIPYFPTVLAFCAATFAYGFDPSLADDKVYLVLAMLVIFWGLTVATRRGLRHADSGGGADHPRPVLAVGGPAQPDPVTRRQARSEPRQRSTTCVLRCNVAIGGA
jgi:amino acid transporter